MNLPFRSNDHVLSRKKNVFQPNRCMRAIPFLCDFNLNVQKIINSSRNVVHSGVVNIKYYLKFYSISIKSIMMYFKWILLIDQNRAENVDFSRSEWMLEGNMKKKTTTQIDSPIANRCYTSNLC